MSQQTLVLASSSPFRKTVLEKLGLPFICHSPEIDESPKVNESPTQLVKRLSIEKAQAVAAYHQDCLIIGSDQVAVHENKIVGKPHTHENAVAQLREASGKSITLYTGLTLLNSGSKNSQSVVVPFTVQFRVLDDDLIESYLRKEQPYQCAGSVRSEGLGILLLEKFDGSDPNALIGLPLIELITMLNNEGFSFFAEH